MSRESAAGKKTRPITKRRTDNNTTIASMETDYCTGITNTLEETALKYAVSLDYAQKLSSKLDWTDKRAKYLQGVQRRVEAEMADLISRERRKALRSHLERASLLHTHGMDTLRQGIDNTGDALKAIALASELERKVLKMDESAQVNVQVAVVPLIAGTQQANFNAMVRTLEAERGTDEPEEGSGSEAGRGAPQGWDEGHGHRRLPEAVRPDEGAGGGPVPDDEGEE